jgi:ABC-type transporter Mla subunit MlaD
MAALGYPITQDNIERVQAAMDEVAANSAQAQARIQTTLSQLSVIDGQIATARNTSSQILNQLRGEAQRLANSIGIAMSLPIQNKIYAVSV